MLKADAGLRPRNLGSAIRRLFEVSAATRPWSFCALRFRSLQGFVTMPPKPPLGKTS